MTDLTAYVDGSYNKETMTYGSGIVILNAQNDVILEKAITYTDNKFSSSYQIAGEVLGAKYVLEYAKRHNKSITIKYDYLGIEKWATGEWSAKKPISQEYVKYFESNPLSDKIKFEKVKAHSGVEYNELADELAKIAVELI